MRREQTMKIVKTERISNEATTPVPEDVQATGDSATSSGYTSGSVSNSAASVASTSSAIARPASAASTTSAMSNASSATSTHTIVSAATNEIPIPMPMVRVKLEKLSMMNGFLEKSVDKNATVTVTKTNTNKRKSIDIEMNDDAEGSDAASKKVKVFNRQSINLIIKQQTF